MDNNDILIRLRYALDIKDYDMVKIFQLGGTTVTTEDVKKILKKTKGSNNNDSSNDSDIIETEKSITCDNSMLESFLNGFIIYKRGEQEPKQGNSEKPTLSIMDDRTVNNVMLKKLKIALELTSDDILNIFYLAGAKITKGELSAVLRKKGHRNYKECGDRYARNFLKGLTIKHRK